jgi:transposase
MRGASFLVAVTFAAEIGDVRRFDTPRQLASFLGLVPAESSTGDTTRRKGLTLAGNRRARRALVEAAWTYRYPARVGETLRARARRAAQARARHRLESADPSVRPLSPPQRRRQEDTGRCGRDRAGDGRLPMGHRTRGCARVNTTLSLLLRRPGSGARRWGTPVASYGAGPQARRPSSRPTKAPRRRHGKAVSNPPIRV